MVDFQKLREEYIGEIEKLPYGEGVLILPNSGLQREVKLRHMIECMGLDSLAEKVVNQSKEEKKFDLLSRQAQELLVEHLLREHRDELKYFGPLIGKKGLVRELTALFTEFRRCYVESAEELQEVFDQWQEESNSSEGGIALVPAPVEKNGDVVLLFKAYVNWIIDPAHEVYDLEGLYMLAIELLKNKKVVLPYKKIFISDYDQMDALEEEFVKCLHQDGKITWNLDNSNKNKGSVLRGKQRVFMAQYSSHQEELEGVLREIRSRLDRGEQPEDFLVAVKKLREFTGVKFLAEKFGVPLTMPRMEKVSQHPLTAALFANLGEGETWQDWLGNAREYLQNLGYEKDLGEAYSKGKMQLLSLQHAFGVRNKLQECLAILERTLTLCSFLPAKMSREDFITHLADNIKKVSYITIQGDSRGVLLTEEINALGHQRPYLYVIGINEGEWPAPLQENWIYTDPERKSMKFDMGIYLPTAYDHYLQDGRNFAHLLQMGKEEVHLFWTCRDNMDKSIYVEELLKELQEGTQNLPMKIVDYRGWQWNEPVPMTDDEEELRYVAAADYRRKQDSQYDGGLAPLQPKDGKVYLSASSFGKYVKCPFAYMGEYFWNEKQDDSDPEELAPYESGNLVHAVIKGFYEKLRYDYGDGKKWLRLDEVKGLDRERKLALLQKLFDAEKQAILAQKTGSQLLAKELAAKFDYVRKWFDHEEKEQAENEELRPCGFEKKFENFEPVQGLSCRVLFNGKIDRVDSICAYITDEKGENGRWQPRGYYVTDYKTGNTPVGKANVQVPLYVLEMRDELGLDEDFPVCGSYLSLKDDAKRAGFIGGSNDLKKLIGKIVTQDSKNLQSIQSTLMKKKYENLVPHLEAMLQGNFGVSGNEKTCQYCQFRDVCRKSVVMEDSENE